MMGVVVVLNELNLEVSEAFLYKATKLFPKPKRMGGTFFGSKVVLVCRIPGLENF